MEDSCLIFEAATDVSSPATVKISGAVTILTVGKLQKELLSAFENTRNVIMDLSGVTELDLAGMQFLCSAHRSFLGHDQEFSTVGLNQHIWDTAAATGHIRQRGCKQDSKNTCIWIKGNYQP